jgi:heme-degrading monooxygenase HmoA
MIARIWHGYTTHANAEAYAATLKAEILPGIMKVPGYKGSYLLQRPSGEEVEFVSVTLWESVKALREFAGPDYERAIVPVERRKFLFRYDECSAHYEISLRPQVEETASQDQR